MGEKKFRNNDSQLEIVSKQRSIYPTRDIEKSEVISLDNIRVIRPGFSLEPKFFDFILGKQAVRYLRKGERIKLEDFE